MRLAEKVNRQLRKYFPPQELLGREVSYSEISKRLNKALRCVAARGRVVKSTIISDNEKVRPLFDIIGSAVDEKIVVTVLVSPVRDYYVFTWARYRHFLFTLSAAIQHELIHRDQSASYKQIIYRRIPVQHSRRIRPARVEDIDYYREWREVDAYAHDIAMEINYYYAGVDTMRVMRHIESYRKLSHFRRYITAFHGTEWSLVRKTLIKKIIKWLPSAKTPLDSV